MTNILRADEFIKESIEITIRLAKKVGIHCNNIEKCELLDDGRLNVVFDAEFTFDENKYQSTFDIAFMNMKTISDNKLPDIEIYTSKDFEYDDFNFATKMKQEQFEVAIDKSFEELFGRLTEKDYPDFNQYKLFLKMFIAERLYGNTDWLYEA